MKIKDLRYSGYSDPIRLGSHVRWNQDPVRLYRIVALQAGRAVIRPETAQDDQEDLLVSIAELSLV